MSDNDRHEKQLLRGALGQTADCPPLLQIDQAQWAVHVASCTHCRTELELMNSFEAATFSSEESAQVNEIVGRLRTRSGEIFPSRRPVSWWAGLVDSFTLQKLGPVALGFAALLVVVGITIQMRHSGPPSLQSGLDGPEVMRAGQLQVRMPVGDLDQVPNRIEWSAAPGVGKFVVRLLEVDGNELWKAEVNGTNIVLPAAVQALLVPAKTILCEVAAVDATGRASSTAAPVRFRVRQRANRQ